MQAIRGGRGRCAANEAARGGWQVRPGGEEMYMRRQPRAEWSEGMQGTDAGRTSDEAAVTELGARGRRGQEQAASERPAFVTGGLASRSSGTMTDAPFDQPCQKACTHRRASSRTRGSRWAGRLEGVAGLGEPAGNGGQACRRPVAVFDQGESHRDKRVRSRDFPRAGEEWLALASLDDVDRLRCS
ncbi:hypothetical protein BJY59DRAFT_288288 [Rhodotorula toruloides]